MKRRMQVAMTVAGLVVGLSVAAVYANVMLQFSPDSGGGVPAYARIERLPDNSVLVHHTEDWAAITFYREPRCVPADFDLLNFFDGAAFECRLTVEGFEIWRNGPWAGDAAPVQTESFGVGAVPIWFVAWGELQSALADGTLTVPELGDLGSLRIGSASFFKETLHPSQGARRTKTQIVARGTLQDGTPFYFQVEENDSQLKHVAIEFK